MSENLGFLTVIDQSPSGLTGGYLVLNRSGRPLEFHCTMPICPDKIQQILYGDSLQPFLYGERIAHTLLQRSKLPVFSVLTNNASVLPVQSLVSVPVIYVFESPTAPDKNDVSVPVPLHEIPNELSESLKTFGIDHTHRHSTAISSDELPHVPHVPGFDAGVWREVRIGNRLIAVPEMDATACPEGTREQLISEMKERARMIDLLEPFARISLALEEAKNAA